MSVTNVSTCRVTRYLREATCRKAKPPQGAVPCKPSPLREGSLRCRCHLSANGGGLALALCVASLGCSRPSTKPAEVGAVAQAMTDISSIPVGSTWDRLNQDRMSQCVAPTVDFRYLRRLSARAFRVSSETEVTSKLAASVELGVKAGPVTASTKLSLEQAFKTTLTNEIYVIAVSFLEQEGSISFPTVTPTSYCPAQPTGRLKDFFDSCGTDNVSRVVHGGFAFLWVNGVTLGAALPGIREKLGSLNESIEVDALALVTDVGQTGVSFTVESDLGVPGGSGKVLTTPDILRFLQDLYARAGARALGSPEHPRLTTELSAAQLRSIDACVGPTGLTPSQWQCLHEQLVRLSDFAREEGPGLNLLQKYEQALAILERLRTEPEPFIFPATTQALCDSVRPLGQPVPPPDQAAAVCAQNIYTYIAANYQECRSESQAQISQCLAAIEASAACDSREEVFPPACRLSSKCETLINASVSAPPPEDRGNRPTVPPGSNFRPNRTYSFSSGGRATTEVLTQEPSRDTICFLMGFSGLFDDYDNYVNVVEGPTTWQVDFRTATGGSDLTRYNDISVECVDKTRFRRAFWIQGAVTDICLGPDRCRRNIPATVLPAPRSLIQTYSALAGFGGRWQHWEDRVSIENRAVPLTTRYDIIAVSGDSKRVRINWFAADPALVHPSFTSMPPASFSLLNGSEYAKTVFDVVSGLPVAPRQAVVLPVTTTTGMCFLSTARGEFVRNEDAIRLLTVPTGQYVLLVNSGWNTVDRRDVYARAQCVLY